MGVSKFSSEVRERSVQLVLEQEAQHKSQWQAVNSVAQKLGCHAATVLSWVRQYERDGGRRVSGKMSSVASSVGNGFVEGQLDGVWYPQA